MTIKISRAILFSVIKKNTNVEPQMNEEKSVQIAHWTPQSANEKSARIQWGPWGLIDNAIETTHIRTDVNVSLSTDFCLTDINDTLRKVRSNIHERSTRRGEYHLATCQHAH